MAVIADPSTGRTLVVDLSSAGRVDAAQLPSHTVEDGLPVTWRRTRMPIEFDVEVLLAAVPGDGAARDEVVEWIEDAASNARRLRVEVPGIPEALGMMIGDRSWTADVRTSTVRLRMSLREVRVVSQVRGAIAFPPPRPDLKSGRTSTQDKGEAATTTEEVQRSWLSALSGVGG